MIWLTSPGATAASLPAVWLIETGEHPANLTQRSVLRRAMARRIIAGQFALPPDAVAIDHDATGRPLLAHPAGTGLHLSLATRAGVVAVALAHSPVGVDVERIDPAVAPALAALSPHERAMLLDLPEFARPLAFAQLWSAKEAYVKALGTGFLRAPESFSVALHDAGRFSVDDPQQRQGRTNAVRTGCGLIIKNGGQGSLAAAVLVIG